ncbi:hypothetical protein [Haemophilus parahaemolyticus]|jgi:hypothetical protein
MVIIEANTGYPDTPRRVLTFYSVFTAFYFLKGVSFFTTIEDIITLPNKTKIRVNLSHDDLSQWDGATRRCKDNKANDKEFLFFVNSSTISDDLINREKEREEQRKEAKDGLPNMDFGSLLYFFRSYPSKEEIELEKTKLLNAFIDSLGSKVIDIEEFENNRNNVYLITVE